MKIWGNVLALSCWLPKDLLVNVHMTRNSMKINFSLPVYSLFEIQGIIFLVSHRNLLCIFSWLLYKIPFVYIAVFLHRSVQNLVWNICLLTEVANQIWRGKLFLEIGCAHLSNLFNCIYLFSSLSAASVLNPSKFVSKEINLEWTFHQKIHSRWFYIPREG